MSSPTPPATNAVKQYIQAPRQVEAFRCVRSPFSLKVGWQVTDKTNQLTYWVSDENFEKSYIPLPEGSEIQQVVPMTPQEVPLDHETLSEKTFKDIYPLTFKEILIPEWLRGMGITKPDAGSVYICKHDRQLTICAECAPEADRRFKEWKESQNAHKETGSQEA